MEEQEFEPETSPRMHGNKMNSVISFLLSVKQTLIEFWRFNFISRLMRNRNNPELYEPD